MRKALLAAVSLVTGMVTFYAAAAGPAAAEPANNGNGSAYGLSASGLIAISPTITTSASQPPDTDAAVNELLSLPIGGLAVVGAVGVAANAHQADDITPELATVPDTPGTSEPVVLGPSNIRALAKTAGLGLAFEAPPGLDPILDLLQDLGGLLTADAVTSEAVAKCVDGQPVFDAGYQIAGLGGVVGGILDPLVQVVLDALLLLLGPDAALSAVISIAPGVVTEFPDGIAIDALTVSIPLLDQTIVVSHSEVHMAADCTVVAPPPATTPDGPGGPGGRLASTGAETPFLPIGVGLVALALVGAGVLRHSRKTATQ